jgi:hypothetical protein
MIKVEETAFHAGCLRKRRRQAGRTARIMQRRDARCERSRFRLAPSRTRLRRIGFGDFKLEPFGQRSLCDFLAVAPGKVEHARSSLQRAGQRPDQFVGFPRWRRRQPPAARLSRSPGARADDIERRGRVGGAIGMKRLVASRDHRIIARSLWPDRSGPDFDCGKADDGKAKPAQPGRARICVLARAKQGYSGARRPLSYRRGVGVRVRAGSTPLCRGWFPHPSRPQPMRCWPSTPVTATTRGQSSPPEPSSRQSRTRSSRGSEKTDAPPRAGRA